ncbi:hypothetical protein GJ496_003475 [Pomphorhynchus laevis]|nr:hypothetical protein GJ496_003475 [Pomphorhynchus laevis]
MIAIQLCYRRFAPMMRRRINHQCLGHDHSSPSISTDRNMHSWAGQCPTNLITGGEDENIPNPCTRSSFTFTAETSVAGSYLQDVLPQF